MLTFLLSAAMQWKGWGGVGHVNVSFKLHTCGCYAMEGLGWGGAC